MATVFSDKVLRGKPRRKRLQRGDAIYFRSGDSAVRAVFLRLHKSVLCKVYLPGVRGSHKGGVLIVRRDSVVRRQFGDIGLDRKWSDVESRNG